MQNRIQLQYCLDVKSFRIFVYQNIGNFYFLSNKFPFQSGFIVGSKIATTVLFYSIINILIENNNYFILIRIVFTKSFRIIYEFSKFKCYKSNI